VSTRLLLVAWALAAAHCSRSGFETYGIGDSRPGDSIQAAGDSSTAGDPTSCVWGPFSTPVNLTAINSTDTDWGPGLSADGLELLFSSDRDGSNYEIWRATRAAADQPFVLDRKLDELTLAGWQGGPTLSADGLTLFYRSGAQQLWTASRPDLTSDFAGPIAVTTGGFDSQSVTGPDLSNNGLRLYFSNTDPNEDVLVASRPNPQSDFASIVPVAGLGTPAKESFPTVSTDELEVFLEWAPTPGGLEQIRRATRATMSDPFSPAQPIPEINTAHAESDPELSVDGTTLIYASIRPDGNVGSNDLWMAVRECL
jgi:hypothetical protein